MHLALQFYKNANSQVLWWINAVRYFFSVFVLLVFVSGQAIAAPLDAVSVRDLAPFALSHP